MSSIPYMLVRMRAIKNQVGPFRAHIPVVRGLLAGIANRVHDAEVDFFIQSVSDRLDRMAQPAAAAQAAAGNPGAGVTTGGHGLGTTLQELNSLTCDLAQLILLSAALRRRLHISFPDTGGVQSALGTLCTKSTNMMREVSNILGNSG